MSDKEIEKKKKKLATHEAWMKNLPEGRGAVFSGCDLRNFVFRGRDIRFAVFSGANLRGADFRCTNLYCAIFNGADLREVNFYGANLRYANFSGADLRGAYFEYVNLHGATFNGVNDEHLSRMFFGRWPVCVRDAETTITTMRCWTHQNDQWLVWTPESPEIQAMHPDASDWWRVHGDAIKAVIRSVEGKHEISRHVQNT